MSKTSHHKHLFKKCSQNNAFLFQQSSRPHFAHDNILKHALFFVFFIIHTFIIGVASSLVSKKHLVFIQSSVSVPDQNFQVDSIIYATGFDLLASGYGFQVGWFQLNFGYLFQIGFLFQVGFWFLGWVSVFRLSCRYIGFWSHVGFPFSGWVSVLVWVLAFRHHNKLASLEAMLVRDYDSPTYSAVQSVG